jgi:hypothetical protein
MIFGFLAHKGYLFGVAFPVSGLETFQIYHEPLWGAFIDLSIKILSGGRLAIAGNKVSVLPDLYLIVFNNSITLYRKTSTALVRIMKC